MLPILSNLQTSGAAERGAGAASTDDQESGLDKGIGNLEGMRDEKSEEMFLDRSFFDFELEFPEAFDTWGYYKEGAENRREDIDSILSGTRTDGDFSGSEAISSVYESDNSMQTPPMFSSSRLFGVESNNRVVVPPLSHPQISPNSLIPGVVEHGASPRDDWESGSDKGIGDWDVEGMRDRNPQEFLGWFHSDWKGDSTEAYYSSGTDEMQSIKYPDDIYGIVSGTTTDGCSENEAISLVYGSDNTMQRPGISVSENVQGLKRNLRGDTSSARRHYRSMSGAPRAGNQHMDSVLKPPFCTRSSLPPVNVSSYPDYSTTLKSDAFSADSLMEDSDRNSHSSLTSSPFFRGKNLMVGVGESLPTFKAHRSSFTGEGNTVEMVHSAPEMILKDTIHHIGHDVADQREAHTSKREKAFEKDISYDSLSQHFGRPLEDARKSFGVSRTAFKTMCRDVGIMRWKYGKRNMGRNSSETRRRLNDKVPGRRNFSSGMPPVQFASVGADTSQDLNKMTVKATYNGAHIRFKLPDLSGKSVLEDNVIKRLHLERNTFTIKYRDDEGEWVIIACDEDVQECIEISRLSKTATIKMLINDQPVDYNAP